MNVKRGKRRTSTSYWRTGLIFGLLLTTLACYSTRTSSSPPPAEPSEVNRGLFINYDKPGAKTPEATPVGGLTLYKLTSKRMGRDMSYRVVLPINYKNKAEERYPVIYFLHGLTGHFNDWTDRTNLVQIAAKYSFIIVTPEGNDGWYSDNPTAPNDQYESYIMSELIPEIDKTYQTDRQRRVIAGLSMGGYGALKFGLKFPDKFSIVGSFSGALRVAKWSEKAGGNKLIGRSIDTVFGPVNSEARKANDVFRLARELTPDKLKSLPYIYLSCGTEDPMIEGNGEFDKILTEKKVLHDYRTPHGVHDWVFWGDQMREFLDVCDHRLKS